MELLTNDEIEEELSELSQGWKTSDYIKIKKEFFFKNFQEALNFANEVGYYADRILHHPKITISYGSALVLLSTHDLGGLSELDFKLAKRIDRLNLDIESQELQKNIEIAKKGNDYQRRKAVGKLGNSGDIRAVSILIKSLNDKDPFVRRLSASSLGKIGSEKAIYPLATKLNQKDINLSYAARDALINIGKPAVPELLKRIKNRNATTRRRATIALGEIRDKDSIPNLIPLLQDEDEGVRWRAAKYIGISWNDEVVNTLKQLEKRDKSNKVREEASKTLKKISYDVKNLLPLFEKGISAINKNIHSKIRRKDFKNFYVMNKSFLYLITYNPHKNRVYIFKGNSNLESVKTMKSNPKWGVITFQNKEELDVVLDAAKESYILISESKDIQSINLIAENFANRFAHWDITIPEDDLKNRRNGYIQKAGWLIQYCFGKDKNGEYLDYYAAHRMTDDSHVRIYDDGTEERLEALAGGFITSKDPEEAKRLEDEYYERNRKIAKNLAKKGFDKFTINMYLHTGMDKETKN